MAQILPKKITVDLNAEQLLIDGERFPWYITTDGVSIDGLGDDSTLPSVAFAILAETVEVIPKEG